MALQEKFPWGSSDTDDFQDELAALMTQQAMQGQGTVMRAPTQAERQADLVQPETVMRAPTFTERISDMARPVYEGLAKQPLGRILDAIGATAFGEQAKGFTEPDTGVRMGAMPGPPEAGLAKLLKGVRAGTLTRGLKGEPGYAYHATNEERLGDIAQSGKLETHPPDFGTDQDMWPDASTEPRSYFGADPENLYQFAPEEGRAVVVRTKRDGKIFRESTGDLFAREPIEAQQLEYLGDDQQWHSVAGLSEPKQAATPRPRFVMDDATHAVAASDTAAFQHPARNAMDWDSQGTIGGQLRGLDQNVNRGQYSLDDVAKGWENTRAHLREQHGDSVTLYRAEAPVGEQRPDAQTLLYGDKALADRFAKSGRQVRAQRVPVDDIVAVYAKPSGYYEFIVKKPGSAK